MHLSRASADGVQLLRVMSVTGSAGKRSAVNTRHLLLVASDSQVILCHQVLIKEKQPKMRLLILMERFLHGICTI